MGISQDHARQAWTHTPALLKKELKKKVVKVQGGMGLELVQEGGFERSWGFKGVWSAGDVVEVIEALLVLSPGGGEGKENVRPSEQNAGAKERFRAREGEMKAEWVTRFYRALDAVDKSLPPRISN
jgi:hypothetical protein